MRKKVLDWLVESCVAADPTVYMYWLVATREVQEAEALDRAVERQSQHTANAIRLVEPLRGRSGVQA